MALTICCTRMTMGIVVAKGIGHHVELPLDSLGEGFDGLTIDGGINVEVGMKD